MERDPYAWIDPFEEMEARERAEWRASEAYSRGSRDALQVIADGQTGQFERVLSHAVERAAVSIAEQIVKPHMAEHQAEYDVRKRIMRDRVDSMMHVASPMLGFIGENAEITLEMPRMEKMSEMRFTVKTTRPFQYSVAMSPMHWR